MISQLSYKNYLEILIDKLIDKGTFCSSVVNSGLYEICIQNDNAYIFTENKLLLKKLTYNPYFFTCFSISLKHNNIINILKFLEEYGEWNYIPIGIEKYIDTKEIVGNDIIHLKLFDDKYNEIEYSFSKKIIYNWRNFKIL